MDENIKGILEGLIVASMPGGTGDRGGAFPTDDQMDMLKRHGGIIGYGQGLSEAVIPKGVAGLTEPTSLRDIVQGGRDAADFGPVANSPQQDAEPEGLDLGKILRDLRAERGTKDVDAAIRQKEELERQGLI